jgi:hypothetical protein
VIGVVVANFRSVVLISLVWFGWLIVCVLFDHLSDIHHCSLSVLQSIQQLHNTSLINSNKKTWALLDRCFHTHIPI